VATLWQSEGVPADHAVSHGALVRRCSPRQLAVQSACTLSQSTVPRHNKLQCPLVVYPESPTLHQVAVL
jgi:hypothetical protein